LSFDTVGNPDAVISFTSYSPDQNNERLFVAATRFFCAVHVGMIEWDESDVRAEIRRLVTFALFR